MSDREADIASGQGPGIGRDLRADLSNLLLQLGEVLLGHGSDLQHIEAEVLMHEYVPQRNNLRPRHLGMTVFEGLGTPLAAAPIT